MNSDDEEKLALALRLSQLSSDDFDGQTPEESALANHMPRPHTLASDGKDDLPLALRLSQSSFDNFDERVAPLHPTGHTSASEASTPPNESEEDDLELALTSPQSSTDIFDEQVRELNRRRQTQTTVEGGLEIPLGEVRTSPPL